MVKEIKDDEELALSVKVFCRKYSQSPAKAYRLLREGTLTRVKSGRRTFITIESAQAWWQSLRNAG